MRNDESVLYSSLRIHHYALVVYEGLKKYLSSLVICKKYVSLRYWILSITQWTTKSFIRNKYRFL
ncbi:MAG: hypothetical protein QE277_01440, partial [Flectobacillus sp.]|nr:hypothetical protein [Flectobacillus sp.]